MRVAWFILLPALLTASAQSPAGLSPGRRVLLHAHNCYPEDGPLRPLMTAALQDNRRDTWPVVILHLDFKSNEPEHHGAAGAPATTSARSGPYASDGARPSIRV